LAISRAEFFYIGLVLVVIGTGLLKPNASAIVGELYPAGPDGARRDAGFSIFYMGINIGAFIGPFICGTLGEKHNWHYGFGAAGVGMVLGLIQYRLLKKNLGEAGAHPGQSGGLSSSQKAALFSVLGIIGLIIALCLARIIRVDPVAVASVTTSVLVGIAVLFFGSIFVFGKLDRVEKSHVGVIVILCAAGALFWAGFEQAGSSFNLFADRYTQRDFGFKIPASWFQAIGPIFVITLAPVMAGVWIHLARRNSKSLAADEIRAGFASAGIGFSSDGRGGSVRCSRTKGTSYLVDHHLPPAHVWGIVRESGWPQLSHEARAEEVRGSNDGCVVPGNVAWQLDCRTDRRGIQSE
jgi:POT family proton-dependent oligopeptide transporter